MESLSEFHQPPTIVGARPGSVADPEHVDVVVAAELLVRPDDDEVPLLVLVAEEPPAPLAGRMEPRVFAGRG